MNSSPSDGVHRPRHPARWTGRALKVQGAAFMLVGLVSALVVALLAGAHVVAVVTRNAAFRGSVSFLLVGAVTFVIGWVKGRRSRA